MDNHGRGIAQANTALLGIINDILDYTKVQSGRLEVEEMTVDLQTTSEDVAELMGAKARERELDQIVRLLPDVPRFVVSDPVRIR